jgi:hypothetical protein
MEIRSGYIEAGNFTARDVSAGLRYHPGFLSLENISLQSSEGTLRGKVAMMAKPGKSVEIRSVADLYNIRINELFTSFNNFGQEFIKDENLEGYLTANVTFRADFDSLWNLDKESLYTRAGLTIREGELIDFEPAKKLSRFIEVEELERIAFSTLENQILIEEGSILIPEMDISSSAFDISVSGTHSFDNYLDYKMKIRLSELLTRKARRAKKENEENFVVEDDPRRASIYLSISGNSNDPEVKYDQKQAMASVKEDLREEKKNLKTILNEEFGLFDKDSTVQKLSPDRESPRFILEWDEEESETADTTRKRKRRR